MGVAEGNLIKYMVNRITILLGAAATPAILLGAFIAKYYLTDVVFLEASLTIVGADTCWLFIKWLRRHDDRTKTTNKSPAMSACSLLSDFFVANSICVFLYLAKYWLSNIWIELCAAMLGQLLAAYYYRKAIFKVKLRDDSH